MSKLIRRLLGALLVLGFFMESPVMAQTNLSDVKFRITRVGSQDLGGPFLIFVDDATKNTSGCVVDGGWNNALMVPRSLPNFNEMVSLATAAMLAGKQIIVWTGSEFWNKPCGDASGGPTGSTTGTARISRLDVIN
jgi:hypothetical protein